MSMKEDEIKCKRQTPGRAATTLDMLRATAGSSVGPRCSRRSDGWTEVGLCRDVSRFRAENSILMSVTTGTGHRSFRPVPTPSAGSAWGGTGRVWIMMASGSPGWHLWVVPRKVGTFLIPLETARSTGEAFVNQTKTRELSFTFRLPRTPASVPQLPPSHLRAFEDPPVRAGWEEKPCKAKDGHAGRALWLMWPCLVLGTAPGQVCRAQDLDLPRRVAAATKGPQAVAVSEPPASPPG